MPRRQLPDRWILELPRLDDAALLARFEQAKRRESEADAPGMGRNPKVRREWNSRARAAAAELERRMLL
jgi:hypothetical protein